MKCISVSCALITIPSSNGMPLILLAQKSNQSQQAGKYEFPGGKIEADETAEESIHREIKEELTCDIRIINPLTPVESIVNDVVIRLIPFLCQLKPGSKLPIPLEHQKIGFFTSNTLITLELSPADIPIYQEYLRQYQHLQITI